MADTHDAIAFSLDDERQMAHERTAVLRHGDDRRQRMRPHQRQRLFAVGVFEVAWEVHLRIVDDRSGQRSPRSPCPLLVFFVAFRFRSFVSDRPTSSDSLNRPVVLRRTYRLSVPVLTDVRFAALRFAALRFAIRTSSYCDRLPLADCTSTAVTMKVTNWASLNQERLLPAGFRPNVPMMST